MLILLEERLENVRDTPELPKIIRIAAIASLLVVEKYSKLSELSEVYRIAMGMYFTSPALRLSPCATVMCPDKKLAWFDDEQAETAEELVRQRWLDTYESFSHAEASPQPAGSPVKVHCINLNDLCGSETKFRHTRSGSWVGNTGLNDHPGIATTPLMHTSRNHR
jgi:hypothetical protein